MPLKRQIKREIQKFCWIVVEPTDDGEKVTIAQNRGAPWKLFRSSVFRIWAISLAVVVVCFTLAMILTKLKTPIVFVPLVIGILAWIGLFLLSGPVVGLFFKTIFIVRKIQPKSSFVVGHGLLRFLSNPKKGMADCIALEDIISISCGAENGNARKTDDIQYTSEAVYSAASIGGVAAGIAAASMANTLQGMRQLGTEYNAALFAVNQAVWINAAGSQIVLCNYLSEEQAEYAFEVIKSVLERNRKDR